MTDGKKELSLPEQMIWDLTNIYHVPFNVTLEVKPNEKGMEIRIINSESLK